MSKVSKPVAAILWSIILYISISSQQVLASWEDWWTYDGISGPEYWGRINPKWSLCRKGQRQSPIDIDPQMLLFDRNLEAIQITGDEVNVTVVNSGRGIELEVSHDSGSRLTISRGPLDYEYTLDHIIVHYGQSDNIGSEHTISGHPFPGEVQLFAFNSQLYANWSESSNAINGIAAISVLIQLSNPDHPDDNQQMKRIISAMRDKSAAAKSQSLSIISIKDLLPSSNHYITYEGSLTQPSCSENVQWIIVNRPLYVSSHRMKFIRNLVNGHASNFRPIQQLRRRCIRTNINFRESSETNETNKSCNMNTFSAIYTTSLEKLDSLDEVGQSAAILLGQR